MITLGINSLMKSVFRPHRGRQAVEHGLFILAAADAPPDIVKKASGHRTLFSVAAPPPSVFAGPAGLRLFLRYAGRNVGVVPVKRGRVVEFILSIAVKRSVIRLFRRCCVIDQGLVLKA